MLNLHKFEEKKHNFNWNLRGNIAVCWLIFKLSNDSSVAYFFSPIWVHFFDNISSFFYYLLQVTHRYSAGTDHLRYLFLLFFYRQFEI